MSACKEHKNLVFDCSYCQTKAEAYQRVISLVDKLDNLIPYLQELVADLSNFAEEIKGK